MRADVQGVIWDEGGRSGGSFGVRVDIQGGHLGCPWTYRGVIWDVHGHTGVYLGCQGEGAEGLTNGPNMV